MNIINKTLLLGLCCAVLSSHSVFAQKKSSQPLQSVREDTGYEGNRIKELITDESAMNFLVVGDWGRNGQFKQKEVAERMGEAAQQLDAQFVISTGDNFYINGVASTEDPAWTSSFENIYTHHALMCNWYPVLGNHDYRGNSQAEIDYSKKSRRWVFPNRYYSFEKTIDYKKSKEKVLFVFIDTNPFDTGLDVERHPDLSKQDTAAQKKWLNETLANSKAKWKIVIGHHPLYTSGKRLGKTQDIINAFDKVFQQHKVDVYFAGHEHDLQHQTPENKVTHHFVSGAGSEIRETGKAPMTKFSASAHGFMTVSL
ncbi:MAG: metallophosphoesterase, partial [Thermoflexibacteraceae bacterium]